MDANAGIIPIREPMVIIPVGAEHIDIERFYRTN